MLSLRRSANPIKGHWVYQHLHADTYLEADVATTLTLIATALRARGVTAEQPARAANAGPAHEALQASLRAAEAKARGRPSIRWRSSP